MRQINFFSVPWLLVTLLMITVINSHAATANQQPIYIESNSLLIDEKKGISYYKGNVKFTQGSLVIMADSIKVLAKDGAITKVLIQGNPSKLKQQPQGQQHPITATANRIEYLAKTEIVHLYGNALVAQGAQRFSGEHIQYNSQTAQVTAQSMNSLLTPPGAQAGNATSKQTDTNNGQGRVKAVIMPKRESKPE